MVRALGSVVRLAPFDASPAGVAGDPHISVTRARKSPVDRFKTTMATMRSANINARRMLRQGNTSANVRSRGGGRAGFSLGIAEFYSMVG